MKTIQQKLADRIYELLPEKKELGFGCEVEILAGDDIEWADFEIGQVIYECGMCAKHKRQSSCSDECNIEDAFGLLIGDEERGYSIVTVAKSGTYKIIGQPIRLADVLMAIQTIHKNNIGIFINQYAMFYEMIDEIQSETLDPFIVKYKNIGWNLSKDNILDQSDDFCEFVYNLIK